MRRTAGITAKTGVFGASPYPGVPAMLEGLAMAGRRLFVATAKRVDFARRMLEHLGLASRFAAVYGALPGVGWTTSPS